MSSSGIKSNLDVEGQTPPLKFQAGDAIETLYYEWLFSSTYRAEMHSLSLKF